MRYGEDEGMFDPLLISLGLFVGVLVGLTGVGGGALLTPLLILVAGVRPVIAIGTDLAFAAITKWVGGWQHIRLGTANWRFVLNLALGSVPGALFGVYLVNLLTSSGTPDSDTFLTHVLGIVLLLAAGSSLL